MSANTTPDATATPRTRCELHQLNRQEYDTLKSMGLLWEVYPNAPDTFDEIDAPAKSKAKIAQLSKTVLDTIQLDREHHARALKAERELAAAKAEIADIRAVDREIYQESLERLARAERAEAELRERTQWMCKCGGTDCAGQADNERLRARVGELENDLEKSKHEADDWHRAWETVTEQAKKEVAELEADKARLVDALKSQRSWWESNPAGVDYEADTEETSPEDATAHIAGLAIQEINAALAAARAGKGAT